MPVQILLQQPIPKKSKITNIHYHEKIIHLWPSHPTRRHPPCPTPAIINDINPGSSSGLTSTKGNVAALGNIVCFSANYDSSSSELWRSNGTAAGTYMVKDIKPGSPRSAPIRLSALGSQILFFANDGNHGDELRVKTPQINT